MYLLFVNRLVHETDRIKNGSVIATTFNLFCFLDMFVPNNNAFLTSFFPQYFKKLQSLSTELTHFDTLTKENPFKIS